MINFGKSLAIFLHAHKASAFARALAGRVFVFAFASLVFSQIAFAETGAVSLESTRSLLKYEDDATQICQGLKENPKCQKDLDLMRTVLGLSVSTCETQKNAVTCKRLLTQFPEYKDKQMRCEPYEVCKQALGTTQGEGCARFGIEMTNGALEALKSERACLTNITCAAQQAFSVAQSLTPLGMMKNSFTSGMKIVKQVRTDKRKYDGLRCLDPETQLQFACYLMVQYGGAVVGGEVAAAKGAELLIARMAGLEKNLALSEAGTAAKLVEKPSLAPIHIVPEILEAYPKLQDQLTAIDRAIAKYSKRYPESNISARKARIWKDKILESHYGDRRNLSQKTVEAISEIAPALRDNAQWGRYAKQLTLDSAEWIRKSGSALEKEALLKEGKISRESMLAVLSRRAQDRGEVIGAVHTQDEAQFVAAVRKGPFVDHGIANSPFREIHGDLVHLLQMDYVAPLLKRIFGSKAQVRNFYREITEEPKQGFGPLFDLNNNNLASPRGLMEVFAGVLPMSPPP